MNLFQDSPSQMHSAHPNIRMQHPGVNSREQSLAEQSTSKPAITFALPMYTVGIAVCFLSFAEKWQVDMSLKKYLLLLSDRSTSLHVVTQTIPKSVNSDVFV